MLKPANPIAVFPQYTYTVGERRYTASRPGDLYAMCKETMPYNEWYALMIHRMCLELPPHSCIGDTEGDQYVKTLRWEDILGFTRALIAVAKTAASGQSVYVSQSEADRRSLLCFQCKYNAKVSCSGCVGIITLAHLFIRGRLAIHQEQLGACKLCGCWLAAKIWASSDVLRRIVTGDFEYPDNCWNKEIKHE